MFEILSVHWDVSPVIMNIGPIQLRWYSILFVSGFILGWFIFKKFFQREGIPIKLLDPLLYTLLIGTIVGARLGHCIFYEPQDYFTSWEGFKEIFKPWHGGLASHGGTIALFIAMWWFARHYGRKHNFDFLWILDHLAIAVCFAAALIRLGNLFNHEIYGGQTTLPWGFEFVANMKEWLGGQAAVFTSPSHPTQLYESLSYLILGIILILLYRFLAQKMYRGTFIGLFFIGCFGMRFLIEFIKNDQVEFEAGMALNMGQWLSIPFILLGIGLLIYSFVAKKPALVTLPEKPKQKSTSYAKPLA